MERNLLTRGLVILVAVAAGLLAAWPPQEAINLGLDLQGGMHLVLRVETDDALRAETDKDIDILEGELSDLGIEGVAVDRTGDSAFEVSGVPTDRDDEVEDDVVDEFLEGWAFDRQGDRLAFERSSESERQIADLAVRQALETIRNRVDQFGVSEPVIHREGIGGNRIVVQLPGVDDPERIKDLIQSTAFLEFRYTVEGSSPAPSREALVQSLGGSLPSGSEIFPEDIRDDEGRSIGTRFWALEQRRVITGRDLKTARPSTGEFNEPVVSFLLTREGGQTFGESTQTHIGRNLAIILDGKVVSAPTIQDRITDSGVIHGSFTMQEVQDLVTVLRSGALPAGLTFLEERTVGPSLGLDSIEKGRSAGLIGGALVVLAMFVVYKLTGINAVTALALNIVFVFGALAIFGATLTVPGIAGIVLTIGMAVDANVLVFERIREELRAGRTVKSAISSGFEKALSSVLDANITTLIAAMFLFLFGTGPIRGFAVTLSVGILASVFTAVFVSRWLFDLYTSRKQRIDDLSI